MPNLAIRLANLKLINMPQKAPLPPGTYHKGHWRQSDAHMRHMDNHWFKNSLALIENADPAARRRRLIILFFEYVIGEDNRLFRRRSKKTSKLRVTGLCEGNSPETGEFPTQRASNAECGLLL